MNTTFAELRQQLIAETKAKVASSVNDDHYLIQASTGLDQLEQAIHRLVKKAREWYGLLNPEGEHALADHACFVEQADINAQGAMGATFADEDKRALRSLLDTIKALYAEQKRLSDYLEKKMQAHCPNITALAGPRIGAQLLAHAGSLERLATVPSSTLQLYGAETALFRHLRDKRRHRSPKYGILFNHPLIQHVTQPEKGKAARALADKLSLCARLDHFKGENKAAAYKAQLVQKFGEW